MAKEKEQLKPGQHWGVDSDVFQDEEDVSDFRRILAEEMASDFNPCEPPHRVNPVKPEPSEE
jgi:hypothetical protein